MKNKIHQFLSNLLFKVKGALPKSFPSRFLPYTVLISVLITLAVVFFPQFIQQFALFTFQWLPPEQKIFATHQILCDEAITQIAKMPPLRKQKLVSFIKGIIEKGPGAIERESEKNWSINLIAKQLATDDNIPILIGNSFGDHYAKVCFDRAISALGADATVLLPLLIKVPDTQLVENITQKNSLAIDLAIKKIMELADAKDPVSQNESANWWKVLENNPMEAYAPVFQIFINPENEKNFPELVAKAQNFLRVEVHQISQTMPVTITKFILETSTNSEVAKKKQEFLYLLVASNYFSTSSEGRELLGKLLQHPEREIGQFAEKIFFQNQFQEQKDIDYFVSKFTPIVNQLDLTKNLGWQQLADFQRLAQLTFPYTDNKSLTLNFQELEILLQNLMKKIVQQVGYQTSTFRDLTNYLLTTGLASGIANYLATLLIEQKDQAIIVQYLSRLPIWSMELRKTVANYLQETTSEQKKLILQSLRNRAFIHHSENLTPEVDGDPLIDVLFSLLTNNDDQIIDSAFYILSQAKDPLLPTILTRLNKVKISDEEKLGLLRLQWQISSTSEVATNLEQALIKSNGCNLHFAMGLTELLTKKADLAPVVPDKGRSRRQEIRDYNDENFALMVPPVFSIIYPKPNPQLVQKYTTCTQNYLHHLTAKTLANYSSAFRAIIESAAKNQSGERKKFWQQALKARN